MLMKHIKTTYRWAWVLAFFSLVSVQAQKEPQYTQYMYNIGSFNPAYVGSVEDPEVTGLYRAQWIDIPGAPTTPTTPHGLHGRHLDMESDKNLTRGPHGLVQVSHQRKLCSSGRDSISTPLKELSGRNIVSVKVHIHIPILYS